MSLTLRIIYSVLICTTIASCNEPATLFERGVRELGFEPLDKPTTLTAGSLIAYTPQDGHFKLVCRGRAEPDTSALGSLAVHQTIKAGWSHRLTFCNLHAYFLSDIDELELAKGRTQDCRRAVQAHTEAGHDVRIVRGILHGQVMDNDQDMRPSGPLGMRSEALFWPINGEGAGDLPG